ncbi:MAG: hypothetical protein QW579_06325 [Desulfurococcaceae archaeon]
MSDFQSFIYEEYRRIIEEEKQRKPPYKLRDEDTITVDISGLRPWRRVRTKFGDRVIVPIYRDNNEFSLFINPNSQLYRKLVKLSVDVLSKNKTASLMTVKVVRSRIGLKVTYDIELLEAK